MIDTKKENDNVKEVNSPKNPKLASKETGGVDKSHVNYSGLNEEDKSNWKDFNKNINNHNTLDKEVYSDEQYINIKDKNDGGMMLADAVNGMIDAEAFHVISSPSQRDRYPENKEIVDLDPTKLKAAVMADGNLTEAEKKQYMRSAEFLEKLQSEGKHVIKGKKKGNFWVEDAGGEVGGYMSLDIVEVSELLTDYVGIEVPDGSKDAAVFTKEAVLADDVVGEDEVVGLDELNQEGMDMGLSTADILRLSALGVDLVSTIAAMGIKVTGYVVGAGSLGTGAVVGQAAGAVTSMAGGLTATSLDFGADWMDYNDGNLGGWQMTKNLGTRLGLEAMEALTFTPASLVAKFAKGAKYGKMIKQVVTWGMTKELIEHAMAVEWIELLDKDAEDYTVADWQNIAAAATFTVAAVTGHASRYAGKKAHKKNIAATEGVEGKHADSNKGVESNNTRAGDNKKIKLAGEKAAGQAAPGVPSARAKRKGDTAGALESDRVFKKEQKTKLRAKRADERAKFKKSKEDSAKQRDGEIAAAKSGGKGDKTFIDNKTTEANKAHDSRIKKHTDVYKDRAKTRKQRNETDNSAASKKTATDAGNIENAKVANKTANKESKQAARKKGESDERTRISKLTEKRQKNSSGSEKVLDKARGRENRHRNKTEEVFGTDSAVKSKSKTDGRAAENRRKDIQKRKNDVDDVVKDLEKKKSKGALTADQEAKLTKNKKESKQFKKEMDGISDRLHGDKGGRRTGQLVEKKSKVQADIDALNKDIGKGTPTAGQTKKLSELTAKKDGIQTKIDAAAPKAPAPGEVGPGGKAFNASLDVVSKLSSKVSNPIKRKFREFASLKPVKKVTEKGKKAVEAVSNSAVGNIAGGVASNTVTAGRAVVEGSVNNLNGRANSVMLYRESDNFGKKKEAKQRVAHAKEYLRTFWPKGHKDSGEMANRIDAMSDKDALAYMAFIQKSGGLDKAIAKSKLNAKKKKTKKVEKKEIGGTMGSKELKLTERSRKGVDPIDWEILDTDDEETKKRKAKIKEEIDNKNFILATKLIEENMKKSPPREKGYKEGYFDFLTMGSTERKVRKAVGNGNFEEAGKLLKGERFLTAGLRSTLNTLISTEKEKEKSSQSVENSPLLVNPEEQTSDKLKAHKFKMPSRFGYSGDDVAKNGIDAKLPGAHNSGIYANDGADYRNNGLLNMDQDKNDFLRYASIKGIDPKDPNSYEIYKSSKLTGHAEEIIENDNKEVEKREGVYTSWRGDQPDTPELKAKFLRAYSDPNDQSIIAANKEYVGSIRNMDELNKLAPKYTPLESEDDRKDVSGIGLLAKNFKPSDLSLLVNKPLTKQFNYGIQKNRPALQESPLVSGLNGYRNNLYEASKLPTIQSADSYASANMSLRGFNQRLQAKNTLSLQNDAEIKRTEGLALAARNANSAAITQNENDYRARVDALNKETAASEAQAYKEEVDLDNQRNGRLINAAGRTASGIYNDVQENKSTKLAAKQEKWKSAYAKRHMEALKKGDTQLAMDLEKEYHDNTGENPFDIPGKIEAQNRRRIDMS